MTLDPRLCLWIHIFCLYGNLTLRFFTSCRSSSYR